MKNKLKFAIASIGFGLATMSNLSIASFSFPDPIAACVEQGMANYCKSTGQQTNCAVPTHIYYEIRRSCY